MRAKQRKLPVPKGKGMFHLKGQANRYFREMYWGLSTDKQKEVKEVAKRYFTSCENWNIRPDPDFFREVIPDIKYERYD